ncbi:MBL fold metallo-hydrolase [Brevibacterium litoralis]|uniref:MBL fold metallo-hydrolase n=1 Tax=Brevibacterium litoralis TaxID=3138935 RepID=UPI0032EE0C60
MNRPTYQHIREDNPGGMTLDGTRTYVLHSRDGQGALLIDPGNEMPEHRAAFLAAVGEAELRAIVLTHQHADHSEMLATADDWAPGVPVYAVLDEFARHVPTVQDGDVITFGPDPADALTVLRTPGHTSDSISLLGGDVLFSGDTVLGKGTTVVTHPEGSLADYLASIDRLRALVDDGTVSVIEPAHGPTVEDPATVLDHYASHRRERVEQVRAALDQGAATAEEVRDVVYADVPENVRAAALMIVKAQLEYLGHPVD